MAVTKLLNLLAISCLAVIASLGPAPVAALSVDTTHQVRNNHHGVFAKKRRAVSTKRCKPRATDPAPAPATTSNSPAPKPTSTKAAPKPSPTSSGSNSGSGSGSAKAGIAWPLGNDPSIKNFKTSKVSKYYTWSPWCVDDANAVGMKCCPMLWGPKQIGDFTKLVKPGYANCAMGFNEPNQPGQADIDPGYATQLWWQYLNPLKDQGYFLVSPACTNAPDGKTWMQNFLGNCNGCQVDAIALHWYGTDANEFIDYVTDFHTTFGKPIWVTEFACQDFSKNQQCSWDKVFSFMNTVTSWMDKTDYVQEYFAFGAMHDMYNVNPANQLLADNGFPTDLGRLYIGS
ncbi:glycoside hydrolase family 128 protein [Macrolepiota fuliginosa MF-IS2]|uniref:Glycoside hydrolase family 128 protein n=1 Tax=Macrolepiota fuliginosa MF-IS2 TaxID=1400762 RepID=A0A9P5XIH4_9AGAR|nr:glycoside hydrolase family 128 protein [Macrolepiota fuliginosa MF-IS2]